ncbi:MAG: protoporphyrinogen oxidase [Candidatus Acidiferrum sp.]
MTQHVRALVIGGGISGLVCGYALQKAGIDVLVAESSPRAGGVIRTERRDGFLIERGPQSFSGTRQVNTLCQELGLSGEKILAPAHAPRSLLIDGMLRQVPLSPSAFFTSSLFNGKTKWSVLRDAVGKTHPPDEDESVANFVRRKFTEELLDRLVGPFVSGIHAGDPERISVRAAFPQLYEAEIRSGSVVRGMLKRSKAEGGPRERPTLQSFREGNETLVRALAANLGGVLRCGVEGVVIRKLTSGFAAAVKSDGQIEEIQADNLILATPADRSQKLLSKIDAAFEKPLSEIEYAAISVVSLGYRTEDVRHSLAGFGFLVPRSAGLRVLGTVWNSSLFANCAPAGHALMTSFVGGATDLGGASLSVTELTSLVHGELAPILTIGRQPIFSSVTVWPRAIPQYNLGHQDRLAEMESHRAKFPGLWFAGNYLKGPSIGACVERALSTAQSIQNAGKRIE